MQESKVITVVAVRTDFMFPDQDTGTKNNLL